VVVASGRDRLSREGAAVVVPRHVDAARSVEHRIQVVEHDAARRGERGVWARLTRLENRVDDLRPRRPDQAEPVHGFPTLSAARKEFEKRNLDDATMQIIKVTLLEVCSAKALLNFLPGRPQDIQPARHPTR
jgi:hypothetical protein